MNGMTKSAAKVASLALGASLLSGCFNDDDAASAPPPAVMMPNPAPTPAPSPMPAEFNVTACLEQMVPGTGITVADAVIPDTLTLNLNAPSGFPNGRQLADPVIDVTLAVIFLDLAANGPGTLAGLPLNPAANDVPLRAGFPYLAAPQGSPPLSMSQTSSFNFRSDSASAYTRVDRMGMPAVSTALIGSGMKNAYNDANPADDVDGTFVPELAGQLTGLTNALADDLVGAGLTPCAVPR